MILCGLMALWLTLIDHLRHTQTLLIQLYSPYYMENLVSVSHKFLKKHVNMVSWILWSAGHDFCGKAHRQLWSVF